MDPKWKKRWVKALRSGKYKQDVGQLKSNQGFCCLGVLCDVVTKTKDGGGTWDSTNSFNFKNTSGHGCIPRALVDFVGLVDTNPEVASGGKKRDLATWNDDHRFTFEQIANIIEREL
jgi:hypothetical protein